MSCKTHNWIGGSMYSIKTRTVSPRGECSRTVYDVIDEKGDHVDTYSWEHEAVEAVGALALGFCSECGALFSHERAEKTEVEK